MEMELNMILENLADAGCGPSEADIAKKLYESGQTKELIRYFKKCRYSLLEEMHESQKRVDRMDYLIRRAEKEAVR